jgi:hypothetical protein
MGVDAWIFDESSQECFYFDRLWNIRGWESDVAEAEGLYGRLHGNELPGEPRSTVSAREVLRLMEICIRDSPNSAYWCEKIKAFVEARPFGRFFVRSDHDSDYAPDLLYREEDIPKYGKTGTFREVE